MEEMTSLEWFNTHDSLSTSLDFRLTEAGEGVATATLRVSDANRNVMGSLHGGALAAFTDTVAGGALAYHGRMCVTMDTSIRYLRAVREGEVTAQARELHSGKQTAVVQVDVRDETGALCCVCTITMFLLDRPHPFSLHA